MRIRKRIFTLFVIIVMLVSNIMVFNIEIMAADTKSILNSAKLNPLPTGYTDVDNRINSIIAEGRKKTKDN